MTSHSIDIRRVEGDDAICSAHIEDWSALVLQSADPDLVEVQMIHGEGTEHDMIIVIPIALLISLDKKLDQVLPGVVGFAFEHDTYYNDGSSERRESGEDH